MLVCVAHLLYAWPCIAFPVLQIKHLCMFCDILSPKALYGCVVLLLQTRDICEEKWIPKDLVPPKKSVAAPKARGKAAPQPRGKPAGLAVQAGAKAAAKPAPRAIASSSSSSATHPVPVMQTEHVQQFKVCYSRTQKFFTVPLDPQ